MSRSTLRYDRLFGLAIVAACLLPETVSAQGDYLQQPYLGRTGNYYGSVDALASRVFSQADFLRATGEASVNYASARKIRAQAYRLELANAYERVKTYWAIKEFAEAERYKRRGNLLDSKRRRNSKTWDRLKNHPDLNGPAIVNGRALNFLLHRLSGSVLAYEYSRDYNSSGDLVSQQVAIPPKMLAGLQLRQHLPDGKSLVFTADDPAPLKVDWWPFALRGEEFADYRAHFEQQRQLVVKEARDGKVTNDSLMDINESFLALSDEFHLVYNKTRRHEGGLRSWQQYKQADSFLKSMWGEIGRLQSVGDISFLDGDLQFETNRDGVNLMALLKFMSRNGLDFAPSKPGGEASYNQAFAMMRDLYANVADDDEALKPQTEKYQR